MLWPPAHLSIATLQLNLLEHVPLLVDAHGTRNVLLLETIVSSWTLCEQGTWLSTSKHLQTGVNVLSASHT